MHDDTEPLVPATVPGAPTDPGPDRRRALLPAVLFLLAMAGVGLASRLDRSNDRIEVGPARPSETGGGTTTAPSGPEDPAPSVRGTTAAPLTPPGSARVTLACGDSAQTREVTTFEVDTAAGGATILYWSEPGGTMHELAPGDQFPAGARLAWSVNGVQLGPWPVDDIVDPCTIPIPAPTTPSRYTVPRSSATDPTPGYDPAWTARATLACGDDATTRRVTSFEPTTNGAGTASLMASDPATGLIQQLEVGDQFAVHHVLSWAIQGVLLGPWPVPEVADDC